MKFLRRKNPVYYMFAISLLLVWFYYSCNTKSHPNDNPKPNVLFIAVDDLRTQLGCYGYASVISPNIDNLAENGLIFNRAYCQMASCGPSRSSLLTSRRPDVTRIFDNSLAIRATMPDVVTLPQQFKKHGYHTQSLGKVFHGIFENEVREDPDSWSVPAWRPKAVQYLTERGLDTIRERYSDYIKKTGNVLEAMSKRRLKGLAWEAPDLPDNDFTDGKIAEKAIEVLKEMKDKDQPFFLAVGFTKPHLPFVAPKKYYDLYIDKNVEVVSSRYLPIGASPLSSNYDSKELRGYSFIVKDGEIPENDAEDLTVAYNACVSFTDAQIGKILDELKRLKLTDNTIVVLWGDNGFHLGQQGLWCKNTNFEAAVRVPLIISCRDNSFAGKKNTNVIVELLDVMPTLCDLASIPVPDGVQGVSLLPLLKDSVKALEKTAVSQHPRTSEEMNPTEYMGYSLRTDQYRYTEWIPKSSSQKTEVELYDFGKYPEETKNVAKSEEYANVQMQLSTKLHEILKH